MMLFCSMCINIGKEGMFLEIKQGDNGVIG